MAYRSVAAGAALAALLLTSGSASAAVFQTKAEARFADFLSAVLDMETLSWTAPGQIVLQSQATGTDISEEDLATLPDSVIWWLGGSGGVAPTDRGVPMPGDTNGDNQVNLVDVDNILDFFNQPAEEGGFPDLNGDSFINFADLNIVLSELSTVPAPGATTLMALGLLAAGARRRR